MISYTCLNTMLSYERQWRKILNTKVGKKKYSKLIILGIEQNCFILRFMSLPIVVLVDIQSQP
jgi:hypothetical protein